MGKQNQLSSKPSVAGPKHESTQFKNFKYKHKKFFNAFQRLVAKKEGLLTL